MKLTSTRFLHVFVSTDGDELLREGKRHGLGFNFAEAYMALFDATVAFLYF
jgi:CMP-N-acetylneuraminic acid synthetase